MPSTRSIKIKQPTYEVANRKKPESKPILDGLLLQTLINFMHLKNQTLPEMMSIMKVLNFPTPNKNTFELSANKTYILFNI